MPPSQAVTWASQTNVTVYSPSNVLHKSGTANAWDAGAISTQSIVSGDGFVSVVADVTNNHRMFGLGNTNQSVSQADIEYGLHLADNGTLEVLESGTSRGSVGSYSVGDVLKVVVKNGVVKNCLLSLVLVVLPPIPAPARA